MQVKSIAKCSAILLIFIKLPFVIKVFVLSIFEWPLKTGFTVSACFKYKSMTCVLIYYLCRLRESRSSSGSTLSGRPKFFIPLYSNFV